MATIDLKNTGNIPSTFYLGVNDAQNTPTGYESFSSGSAISSALLGFTSTYQSVYNAVSTSINWSSGGSGWTVAEVIEVPAGTSPLTMVRFEKQVNGQNYEFGLVGALSVDSTNKNLFTISGSTLIVDGPNGDAEIKLSAATTMKFEQTNLSKTYETQTSFYSGNINQAATSVGALPTGATLKSINSNNLLPTSWTQIGSDTNSFALMTLQGTFNFTSSNNSLGGSVTGMKTVNPVDSGPGFQINTYAIANGKLNPTSAFTPELGIFNSNATLALTTQARSEGPIQVNFGTLIPDLPPNGLSTATYTGLNQVPMSTEIGKAGATGFSGNDIFNVTSNTDTFIHAGTGNDVVNAGAGNDIIYGGAGNDTLNGGAGNDLFLVNQPDGGGNTISNTSSTVNGKTIFSHTLGNNFINGGAGLDTLSFAPSISSTAEHQGNIQTVSVSKTGPNVFTVYDGRGGQSFISIPGVLNTQYQVGNTEVNQYGIAAIELYPTTGAGSKQIYVVDLHTAEVFYHFNLSEGESLLRQSNNTTTTFFTQTKTSNTLTIESYEFGIDGSYNTTPTTIKTYLFQAGVTLQNGWSSDFIASESGLKSYLFFKTPIANTSNTYTTTVYELDNSTQFARALTTLPTIYGNSDTWVNGFFHYDTATSKNQIWYQLGINNQSSTQYYSLDVDTNNYITRSNQEYWDTWQQDVNSEIGRAHV